MNVRTKAITASIILAAPLMLSGVVGAQAAPATPAPGSAFAQRLDQRKKERAIVLDKITQARLLSQCTAGQISVRALQSKMTQLFTDRAKTYQQIDGKLWVTIGQLKLAQKDSFDLEKKRGLLAEKAANAESTAANFQQTLDDIVVINCKADTIGFKALVDTARLYLSQERDQSAAIRSYVIDTIKPALAVQVSDLQPKSAGEGQ